MIVREVKICQQKTEIEQHGQGTSAPLGVCKYYITYCEDIPILSFIKLGDIYTEEKAMNMTIKENQSSNVKENL